MSLVRRALIVAPGLGATMSERLLDGKYDKPHGLVPAIQFVRGLSARVSQAPGMLLT